MSLSLILQSITIILAPLYILRFQIWFPTTLLEVLVLLSLVVNVVNFLKNKDSLKDLKTPLDFYILLFLITSLVSLFFSADFKGGLGIFKAYFIEPVLFYYGLVYSTRKASYRYILNSLFLMGFWLGVLGFTQKLTGGFTLAPHEAMQGRISGVYNSANSLALIIGPIAVLGMAEFIIWKQIASKLLALCLFLIMTTVIIWTKSRGGLIGEVTSLVVILFGFLMIKFRKLLKFWLVLLILLVIISVGLLGFYLASYDFFPNTYGRIYEGGDTLRIRFYIWAGTVSLLKDHPLFGAGLNGFKTLYSNFYRLPVFREEFQYPHNIFLTFWAETGIFGLFSFVLLSVTSLGLIVRNLAKSTQPILGVGFIGGIIYWFIHGFVDVPYFKNDLSLEFWVMLAMIVIWKRSTVRN